MVPFGGAGGDCGAVLVGINDHHADLGAEEEVALAVPSLILSAVVEDCSLEHHWEVRPINFGHLLVFPLSEQHRQRVLSKALFQRRAEPNRFDWQVTLYWHQLYIWNH